MARTTFSNRTALILGADTPAGRACALQLSREGCNIILAGTEARRVADVAKLLRTKSNEPIEVALSEDRDASELLLRQARDTMGHVHFVVNAMGTVDGPSDDPGAPARLGLVMQQIVLGLIEGRGAVRLISLWPDEAPNPPVVNERWWHCLVRLKGVGSPDRSELDNEEPGLLRPAAVGDSVVHLLGCPPSACPVVVHLGQRELQAKTK